jgi:Dolichyl-phosphate-mannose-protein mannosyltransferase
MALRHLTGSSIEPSYERRAMLVILGTAVILRFALAPVVASNIGYLPDVLSYRTLAADLLAGKGFLNTSAMPGYPIFLMLLGANEMSQLIADVFCSVVSVWCVGRLSREITGDALSGLLAATLWAFYPFSIFYAVVGLTETFFVMLILLGFLAYQTGHFTWGSLAMVVGILTRPAVEPLTPSLMLVFVLVIHRQSLVQALKHLVILVGIYVALMSPWWWHNYQTYGQFVRLNLGGGIVLYSGNYAGNIDGGGVDFRIEVSGYHDIADPVERDRVLKQAALQFITENPRRFIELAGLKFIRLWQPWPYAADYSGKLFKIVSAASYLPLLAMAIVGAVWCVRRNFRALLPIALFVGYLTAIHMITIGSIRYRFPMEPFLAVLAGAPAAWIVRRWWRPRTGAQLGGHS